MILNNSKQRRDNQCNDCNCKDNINAYYRNCPQGYHWLSASQLSFIKVSIIQPYAFWVHPEIHPLPWLSTPVFWSLVRPPPPMLPEPSAVPEPGVLELPVFPPPVDAGSACCCAFR